MHMHAGYHYKPVHARCSTNKGSREKKKSNDSHLAQQQGRSVVARGKEWLRVTEKALES